MTLRSTRSARLDVVFVHSQPLPAHINDTEDGDDTMVQPTDLHRVFLQSLLSRRAMTDDTALVMLKRSLGAIRRELSSPALPLASASSSLFVVEFIALLCEPLHS